MNLDQTVAVLSRDLREVRTALKVAENDRKALSDALTATQERCTTLLAEMRAYKHLYRAGSHFDFPWGEAYSRDDIPGTPDGWEVRHNAYGTTRWVKSREEMLSLVILYDSEWWDMTNEKSPLEVLP